MELGSNILKVSRRSRIFNLPPHFQNGDHDVIARRKVLPSGKCRVLHMLVILSPVPDPQYIHTCFVCVFD